MLLLRTWQRDQNEGCCAGNEAEKGKVVGQIKKLGMGDFMPATGTSRPAQGLGYCGYSAAQSQRRDKPGLMYGRRIHLIGDFAKPNHIHAHLPFALQVGQVLPASISNLPGRAGIAGCAPAFGQLPCIWITSGSRRAHADCRYFG